jgi:hypothetical protein
MGAGVVTSDSNPNGWTTALGANSNGKSNPDVGTVVPFTTDAGFIAAYVPGNNLFLGNANGGLNSVTISGASNRFNTSFIIEVVSTSSSGNPIAGGAMGLIVVLANGSTIYKFYNSGVNGGDGKWRRI